MENNWADQKNIRVAALILLGVLSLFVLVKTLKDLRDFRSTPYQNIISVDGFGEVASVPDAASFTFSVVETGKTVAEAQGKATTKSNAIVAYLKETGIEDKDIKTENYSINPQYQYNRMPCTQFSCPPSGNPTISGYEVNQSVTVKVRETEKAGDVLTEIGSRGASNVSGLSFTIDNERKIELQNEARTKAIAEARTKAQTVADALGVRVVRVVSYSDNYYQPYYAEKAMGGMAMDSVANQAAPAPILPTGENKITSNVMVTFEIR
jgi:uncharacterized protein